MTGATLRVSVLALLGVVVPLACSVDTAGSGSGEFSADAGASGTGGTGGGGAAGAPQEGGDDQAAGSAGTGGIPTDGAVDAPADSPPEVCSPTSCSKLAFTCGDVPDGCGSTLHCGDCTAPAACHGGTCASVVFVDQSASGANDGSSWKDAFTSLDQGIAAAQANWQIWVAKGTYKRGSTTSQAVVTMAANVAMYGHFKGTEAGLADRDLKSADETLLDGESTVRVANAANAALLDGFVLQHGSAVQGAGLYAVGIQGLKVANCRFDSDNASDSGGAVYAINSDLSLERTTVRSCNASGAAFGGGLYLSSTTATIDGCEISHNMGGTGGGLYAVTSTLTITNTVFDANQGVYSQSGGGGAFLQNTTAQITSSVFTGNAATQAYGGGLYNETASPTLTNCTFWGNTAPLDGLDVFDNVGSTPKIVNSILWSAGTGHVLDDYPGSGPALVTFSDVRGGWSGGGNLDADPKLVDPSNGNLHLAKGSPCIDAADGTSAPATDAAGQPRYDDPATPNTGTGGVPYADIGAYEYK